MLYTLSSSGDISGDICRLTDIEVYELNVDVNVDEVEYTFKSRNKAGCFKGNGFLGR